MLAPERHFTYRPLSVGERMDDDEIRDAIVLLARTVGTGDLTALGLQRRDELRQALARRLPEYMVPSAFVALDALPLTPNGKVDRRALPAPGAEAFASRGYQAPEGETEAALAEIWRELLGVDRVGRHDHFFQLGGHSLLATRLVSRINREMGVELAPGDVFEHPELSLLAQHVIDVQLAQFDPAQIAELVALARAADGG